MASIVGLLAGMLGVCIGMKYGRLSRKDHLILVLISTAASWLMVVAGRVKELEDVEPITNEMVFNPNTLIIFSITLVIVSAIMTFGATKLNKM